MYFTDSGFSAFCNRMVAVIFAIVMVGVKGESYANAAPVNVNVNVHVNVNVSVNVSVNCTVCMTNS